MGEWGYRLCLVIICGLLLTGCGLTGEDSEKSLKKREICDSAMENAEPMEDAEPAEDHRSAQEILAEMMTDEGFRTRVQYDAGIRDEDTREIIEQKLEQCERLELKNEDFYSLEDLCFLPNLRELAIDCRWTRSQINDFTLIVDLLSLDQLYIQYQEEMDLSFLAQMDSVTGLFLVNDHLKDTS